MQLHGIRSFFLLPLHKHKRIRIRTRTHTRTQTHSLSLSLGLSLSLSLSLSPSLPPSLTHTNTKTNSHTLAHTHTHTCTSLSPLSSCTLGLARLWRCSRLPLLLKHSCCRPVWHVWFTSWVYLCCFIWVLREAASVCSSRSAKQPGWRSPPIVTIVTVCETASVCIMLVFASCVWFTSWVYLCCIISVCIVSLPLFASC